jgi:hypothetical protein
MKQVFSDHNPLIVGNMFNLMEREGIEVIYRNEYTAGAAGELSPLDAWLEVWILDDAAYDQALAIVKRAQTAISMRDWVCSHCHEVNASSFEICWKCQTESP